LTQTGDWLAAASNQDIHALLDLFEVLTEPIMQLAHPNFRFWLM